MTTRIKHLDGNKLDFSLEIAFLLENELCLALGCAEVKGHHSRWIPLNENTGKIGNRDQKFLKSSEAGTNSPGTAQKMPHRKLILIYSQNSYFFPGCSFWQLKFLQHIPNVLS